MNEKDYHWQTWKGYFCDRPDCDQQIETFSDGRGRRTGDRVRCDCGARGIVDVSGLEVEWDDPK